MTARIRDVPRLHRPVPVVVPLQLVADLRDPPVDDHAVLGEPGARGPLRSDLQPDDVTVAPARAPAPVPLDLVGPAPAPDIEHAPRVGPGTADDPTAVADDEFADGGARLMLRREVERLVVPRNHDVDRLVTGGAGRRVRRARRDDRRTRSSVARNRVPAVSSTIARSRPSWFTTSGAVPGCSGNSTASDATTMAWPPVSPETRSTHHTSANPR